MLHFQSWQLHQFPGQSVPMSDHPLREVLSGVQSTPAKSNFVVFSSDGESAILEEMLTASKSNFRIALSEHLHTSICEPFHTGEAKSIFFTLQAQAVLLNSRQIYMEYKVEEVECLHTQRQICGYLCVYARCQSLTDPAVTTSPNLLLLPTPSVLQTIV